MEAAAPHLIQASPESLAKSQDAAVKRFAKLEEQVIEAMDKQVGGFWELPPRQRLAIYLAKDQEYAGGFIEWVNTPVVPVDPTMPPNPVDPMMGIPLDPMSPPNELTSMWALQPDQCRKMARDFASLMRQYGADA